MGDEYPVKSSLALGKKIYFFQWTKVLIIECKIDGKVDGREGLVRKILMFYGR